MRRSPLPKLVWFLIVHAAIGFAAAGVFTGCLIYGNIGGIGTLLSHADDWPIPTLLLWFLLGLTSSSCQMGAAVMLLGEPPRDGGHSAGLDRLLLALRVPRHSVQNAETGNGV